MTNSTRCLVVLAVCLCGVSGDSQSQQKPELWAVIGVSEPIVYDDSDYKVNVVFGLVNDSREVANTTPDSWKILINSKGVPESGFIFVNGPGPVGGWGTLPPGESFIFGKTFTLEKYFSKPGIYEITWKGSTFSARPVLLRVLPHPH